jgi:23S rRNA (pseudouridine1915-N3)-methyltransferase
MFEEYRKRIGWNVELVELKSIANCSSGEERSSLESKKLLEWLDGRAGDRKLIVLDERGKNITTGEFSQICTTFINRGNGLDFIIGGADGLSQAIRSRADFLLALGRMVYPHMLVRLMLIEQIYRIYSISINHPYHRE